MSRREEIVLERDYYNKLSEDDNMYHTGAKRWMAFELNLIDNEVDYEQCQHGYKVDKFIITANGKWCVEGKYKWYRFNPSKTLELLDKLGVSYG